jgi:hypothetical protein
LVAILSNASFPEEIPTRVRAADRIMMVLETVLGKAR